MKTVYSFLTAILMLAVTANGQMTVGANTAPNAASVLDLSNATTLGLYPPQVALTATNTAGPVAAPPTSLMVYNTATAGAAPNNVTPGYYYNAGTPAAPNWVMFAAGNSSSSTSWLTLGNGGTNPSTNFIGTTDNNALKFEVNNILGGYIDPANSIATFGRNAGNIGTTTATSITALGSNALKSNSSGVNNTAVGDNALGANTTGAANTAVGYTALSQNNATQNTGVGYGSLFANTSGTQNTSVGGLNLEFNTTGSYNTSVGSSTIMHNTTASNNTVMGYQSLFTQSYTNGGTAYNTDNTAIGYNTLFANQPTSTTNGIQNIAVGSNALSANTTGAGNTAIGYNTGVANTTGTNNTFVGYATNVSSAALTNATAIGYSAIVGASNSLILGGAGANGVNVGIRTTTPNAAAILDLSGGTTLGIFPTQVALTATNAAAPLTNPPTSLLVYNTVTAGVSPNNVVPGYYYNSGTPAAPNWVMVLAGNNNFSTSWLTLGNGGTNANINFVGTTDANGLKFRVNNTLAGYLDPTFDITTFGKLAGNVGTTTAASITAIGANALKKNTSGAANTAIGDYAITTNTSGVDNTAVGYSGLYNNTVGNYNAALGYNALEGNSSANNNTAVGYNSLYTQNFSNGGVAYAANNTAIGFEALYANQPVTTANGIQNTGVGMLALSTNTNGYNNTGVGYNTGGTNTTGSNNTFVGYSANSGSAALTNATAIGANAVVSASNALVLGGTGVNAVNVGIGTTTPNAAAILDLSGGTTLGLYPTLVALTATNAAAPLTTPPTSLLVYNTATTGTSPNNVIPGYYYNAGTPATPNWVMIQAGNNNGSTAWMTLGNGGTNPSTNFIGTTDNNALKFKVNNLLGGYIDPANSIVTFGRNAGNIGTTTATSITALGSNALKSNSSGVNNTAVGDNALGANTTGAANTAIGYNALSQSNATQNTALGYGSLFSNSSGAQNTAVGGLNLEFNTTGSFNTSVGSGTAIHNTTANNNTVIGYESLFTQSFSNGGTAYNSDNTAVGYEALFSDQPTATSNGIRNIAVGSNALSANTTGTGNTAIGYNTGLTNATGANNTFVGFSANAGGAALTNATAIGANAVVSASNAFILGGTGANAVNVGIGTATPNAAAILDLSGGTTLGIYPTQVSLTATNVAAPLTSPPTSLLVYNTATTGTAPYNVTPGYYYNSGTPAAPNWVMLSSGNSSSSTSWLTLGNAGTSSATNYIGTTDATDFVTRTAATERMRVFSGGGVGIGTTTQLGNALVSLKAGSSNTFLSNDNNSNWQVANSGGTYEFFLTPRGGDNITYMNYGSGGMTVRTNGSLSTLFMTSSNQLGINMGGSTTTNPASPTSILEVAGNNLYNSTSYEALIKLDATTVATSPFVRAPIGAIYHNYNSTAGASYVGIESYDYTNPTGTKHAIALNEYGGNVGIGTSNPTTALHVKTAAGNTFVNIDNSSATVQSGINFLGNGALKANMYFDPTAATYGANGAVLINNVGATTPNTVLNLTNGYVGIGIAIPTNPLHVKTAAGNTFVNIDNSVATAQSGINLESSGTAKANIYFDPTVATYGTYGAIVINSIGTTSANTILNPAYGNVGMGTPLPNAAAELDMSGVTTKGIYPTQVALTATNAAAPLTNPPTSLLVYNTASAGVSPNNVVPGYYYNAGTPAAPNWVMLAAGNNSSSTSWLTLGNAGTTPGTNFVGTTDNKALEFKVNNILGGYIDPANSIATFGRHAGNIGTTTATSITAFGSNALNSNSSGANNTAIGDNALGANTTGAANVAVGYNALASSSTLTANTAIGYVSLFANTSGTNNTSVGGQNLAANISGSSNTSVGSSGLFNNTSGSQNTALGYQTLNTQSFANGGTAFNTDNTAIGYQALFADQPTATNNGIQNIAVGSNALAANTIGTQNTATGYNAGRLNSTGSSNTFIGSLSGNLNTTGGGNVFVGAGAGADNTTTSGVTAIGYFAGGDNTAADNVFVGYHAGASNITGAFNTFLGYQAGFLTTAGNNTLVGSVAGQANTIGTGNAMFGDNTGTSNISGNKNTFIGESAGTTNSTGSNNTVLGYGANVATNNLTNATAIGYSSVVSSSNALVLGGTGANQVNVGIGTTAPSATEMLTVTGAALNGINGTTTSSTVGSYGVRGSNATAVGSLGYTYSAGINLGVFGFASSATDVSVLGSQSNGDGISVEGINNAASGSGGTGVGIYGNVSQGLGFGVVGLNTYSTVTGNGTGVAGGGNNQGVNILAGGSGGSFTGYTTGVFAYSSAANPTVSQAVYCNNAGVICRVDYFDGTTQYKILGTGTVSTIVKATDDSKVVLHAPEAPEIYFEDYGEGALVNGKVHINIDPSFAKNVTINDKHPLRVFIQLEGDCKGVYVTNKTTKGFDVVELNSGASNVSFQWHIVCNRADEDLGNGRISKNADQRFEKAPADLPTMSVKNDPK